MRKRLEMGQAIVRFEGRYRGGNLQVYNLPKADRGDSFEVAGINERYYSEMSSEVCILINCGEPKEAEQMAPLSSSRSVLSANGLSSDLVVSSGR